MKKKMVMYVLGAVMVAGLTMANPNTMPVHAAEDEVGDILDGIFGGDKPEYNPDAGNDAPVYGHGEGYKPSTPDSDSGSTGGSGNSDNSNNQPTPPSQPETPSQPNNGGNSGNTGNSGNSGNSGSGSSNQGNSGSTTTPGGNTGSGNVTLPGNGNLPTSGNGGATGNGNAGAGNGGVVVTPPTTVAGCVTVPVVDKNLLAVFPDAMYVYTPEGAVSFNSLDATKMTYNVWVDGQIANQFAIVDAKNNLVALSAPQIVNDGTGKTYVNVTVPEGTAGAKVLATEAQESAFTRLYGIDGVMVNGVLVEAFQDTVRN